MFAIERLRTHSLTRDCRPNGLTEQQVTWLLNVKRHILRRPLEFDADYFEDIDELGNLTMCIAGWHVVLNLNFPGWAAFENMCEGEPASVAACSLGVPDGFFRPYTIAGDGVHWPVDRIMAHSQARNPFQRARVGARLIDDYISGKLTRDDFEYSVQRTREG